MDDESGARSHVGLRRENAGTRFGISEEAPRMLPDELRRAFNAARTLAVHEAPAPRIVRGYRLAWATDGESAWVDVEARTGAFVVVGRHTCCDLVLPRDEDVSLRHALVTASVDDGDVTLRVLDLVAAMPIYLADDQPHRSLSAVGTMLMRFGRYVVGAFPIDAAEVTATGSDDSEIPSMSVRDLDAPARRRRRDGRQTNIDSFPSSRSVIELASDLESDDLRRASLSITREGRGATVAISERDLALGVLIGRADKCVDGGLRALMTARVSRSHVLLLAQGNSVVAYDTASTNGTFVEGQRVRVATLDDAGTTLVLAGDSGVTLTYKRRPAAQRGPFR